MRRHNNPIFFARQLMYPFPQTIAPAVRTHIDAQTAFMNDMSKSLFSSFQQMCDLNIQLVQTMLEETTLASKHVLSADRQSELLSAATARTQPATEKLRAYQQHIARLAADTQVELANVAERHVNETSRTAKALAEEVARTASEETEKNVRKQQEAMQRMAEPFQAYQQNGANRDQQRGAQSRDGQSLQSASHQGSQQSAGSEGSASGSASQTGSAQSKGSSGRKE
jgi:phasin family protein